MVKRKNRELKEDLRAIRNFKRDKNKIMISETIMKKRLNKQKDDLDILLRDIGEQIQKKMYKNNIDGRTLIKRAGLTKRQADNIILGYNRSITINTLSKIAQALKSKLEIKFVKR